MVILDSDHTAPHVLAELDRFAPMVSSGCYLIIEDTNIGGNPVEPDYETGGPRAAVMDWLPDHPEFVIDKTQERYLLTMNPDGYLRRT
jgi:cephalosporin hydroxylase